MSLPCDRCLQEVTVLKEVWVNRKWILICKDCAGIFESETPKNEENKGD